MIKKIILSWLFGYHEPKYFEAKEFFKNIKWTVEKRDDYSHKKFSFNGFIIFEENGRFDNSTRWSIIEKINDKSRFYSIDEYSIFILHLHDIIHYGIIMPETIEKYGKSVIR